MHRSSFDDPALESAIGILASKAQWEANFTVRVSYAVPLGFLFVWAGGGGDAKTRVRVAPWRCRRP